MPIGVAAAATVAETLKTGILVMFHSPLEAAQHYIAEKYSQMGGPTGVLGAPEGEVTPCPDGRGFFRHFFNNGSIYWTVETGAHACSGSIREKWATLGWERSFLGYPVTDEIAGENPQTAGSYQHFEGGSILAHVPPFRIGTGVLATTSGLLEATSTALATGIHASPTTGIHASAATETIASHAAVLGTVIQPVRPPKPSTANTFEVHGAIRDKYIELGFERSFLGYPVTDETSCPDGVGRFNHFQAGSIYWTPSTGAHEVHGLIRDFWAAHGWERNPALGYPISDELIPDRRIGHVHPEAQRKPIAAVPADMVKLPLEAMSAGAPKLAVNVLTQPKTMAVSPLTVEAGMGVIGKFLHPGPASTPGPERSVNRFSDFENGVVFWKRGATSADALAPWAKSTDGTVIHKSAADIVAASMAFLGGAIQRFGGTMTPAFAGTTAYAWDGAGSQNRRHQINVMVMRQQGIIPHMFSVMLHVLVTFEALKRKVTGCLTDYAASSPEYEAALDPLLWSPFDILVYPDTDGGKPFAILSVKTMPNGDVNTYIEG